MPYEKMIIEFGNENLKFINAERINEKPIKPILEHNGHADGYSAYDSWKCPTCEETYEHEDKYNYCPNCGQKIDSSDYD